jgi:hypothetical protein
VFGGKFLSFCGARSANLTDDEPPELEFYCPDCAEREFVDD